MDEFWSEIRNLIVGSFNETELSNLIFDEGINQNALDHSNVLDLARELLLYVKRNYNKEKQYEFYTTLKEERPNIDWPVWPEDKLAKNKKPLDLPVTLKEPSQPKEKNIVKTNPTKKAQTYIPWVAGLAILTAIIIGATTLISGLQNNAEAEEPAEIIVSKESREISSSVKPTAESIVIEQLSPTPTQEVITPTVSIETEGLATETPSSIPTLKPELETIANQVVTQSKIRLYTQPSDNSDTLRFIDSEKTLTVLIKDKKIGYSYLYIETEEGIEGWVKINSSIKKLNEFDYADISTGFDESDSSASSSTPSSNESVASNNGINVSAADCRLQVKFEYTLESDHEIKWSNVPDETDIMTIRVNRISTPQGDLDPLVEQNNLDMGAISQGVFHVPRTRFDERRYEKNDEFLISLVALDSAGDEICTTSSSFTWDGSR